MIKLYWLEMITMNKVFLYLYPIEEYTKFFLLSDDKLYDKWNIKRPLPILNECIQKRYRDKGYQVVFALYPDKNIFGIIPKQEDKIIITDITFDEASAYYSDGTQKENFVPKYPNEQFLINQLGNIDELVIGGYHSTDCVKRVGETALNMGINTIVDLDLTDLFFSLYRNNEYFQIDQYDPKRYKEYMEQKLEQHGETKESIEQQFQKTYGNPIYGLYSDETPKLKK